MRRWGLLLLTIAFWGGSVPARAKDLPMKVSLALGESFLEFPPKQARENIQKWHKEFSKKKFHVVPFTMKDLVLYENNTWDYVGDADLMVEPDRVEYVSTGSVARGTVRPGSNSVDVHSEECGVPVITFFIYLRGVPDTGGTEPTQSEWDRFLSASADSGYFLKAESTRWKRVATMSVAARPGFGASFASGLGGVCPPVSAADAVSGIAKAVRDWVNENEKALVEAIGRNK